MTRNRHTSPGAEHCRPRLPPQKMKQLQAHIVGADKALELRDEAAAPQAGGSGGVKGAQQGAAAGADPLEEQRQRLRAELDAVKKTNA